MNDKALRGWFGERSSRINQGPYICQEIMADLVNFQHIVAALGTETQTGTGGTQTTHAGAGEGGATP